MPERPNEKTSSAPQIVSWTFITIGLTLAGVLIVIYGITKLPYRADPKLPIPTLDKLDEYTNEKYIDVSGEAIPGETIVLYINGEPYKERVSADDIGFFSFDELRLDEEGKIRFEAATVRGTILKKRSEKSNEISTSADWTPPSENVDLEYFKNSNTEISSIKGQAEKNSYVILNKGNEQYETETDENGSFEFKDLVLELGNNTFKVSVRDKAGNSVRSSVIAEILYELPDGAGDINGNAVTSQAQGKLPESAGEIEAALNFLVGNKIMLLFGILALIGFTLSSTAVYAFRMRPE
ncbi:MAG: Ig-like domain-containing protein [Patescibacteria group bacterium]|nr:Ig-like domain-containing protein [Patescibacteria group bacterium]